MCTWSGGWTRSSGTLEKTVLCRRNSFFPQTWNSKYSRSYGSCTPGNAPGKSAMQFSYSLLSLEPLNNVLQYFHFIFLFHLRETEESKTEPQENLTEQYLRAQALQFGVSTLTPAPPHTAGLSQHHHH